MEDTATVFDGHTRAVAQTAYTAYTSYFGDDLSIKFIIPDNIVPLSLPKHLQYLLPFLRPQLERSIQPSKD